MPDERIAIVSLPVRDQAEAKGFYTDTLGFQVVVDNPMGPGQRWVQLAPSDGGASITLVTWFEQMPAGSLHGLVLDSDDIEATRARLVGKGLAVSGIADAEWGRFATFADPDGNGWVLTQSHGEAE